MRRLRITNAKLVTMASNNAAHTIKTLPVVTENTAPTPAAPTKRLELLIRVGATGSSGLVRVRGHVKSMQAIVIGEKLLKAPRVYPRLT
jgi:hypothetical protein